MRIDHVSRRGRNGSSLLEVLIALALLATAVLGAAAAQLGALRNADVQTNRERAAWIATSIAEALRGPERASHVLTRSRDYAATVLPGGRVSILDEARDVGAVAVRWSQAKHEQRQGYRAGLGACAPVEDGGSTHCVAVPFASGE